MQSVANALQSLIISLYPNPEVVRETTSSEVYTFLKQFDVRTIEILDKPYQLISKRSVEQFLDLDQVSETVYIVHQFDCDNFAFKTFTNFKDWSRTGAFGIVIGVNTNGITHAWNFFLVDDNGKIAMVFVEPQNDQTFDYTSERIRTIIL